MIDGTEIDGGWMNHHWKQLGYQLAGSCAVAAWSFTVTSIILLAMDRIPFLRIRLHETRKCWEPTWPKLVNMPIMQMTILKQPIRLEPIRSTTISQPLPSY